ncbi:hypothetical protein Tcan_00343, partial [Toxocara canis]
MSEQSMKRFADARARLICRLQLFVKCCLKYDYHHRHEISKTALRLLQFPKVNLRNGSEALHIVDASLLPVGGEVGVLKDGDGAEQQYTVKEIAALLDNIDTTKV